eukprot:TRINITY_DN2333_c0_g1_i8.p1 TRINITY_DN2333_c0_g1~~TRINITY_DN2333_c0_g1_i8.p1  ORF type:complete len:223 (+),score=-13.16 TRINITY_DN2333_c0_g1_i8:57-671(+)
MSTTGPYIRGKKVTILNTTKLRNSLFSSQEFSIIQVKELTKPYIRVQKYFYIQEKTKNQPTSYNYVILQSNSLNISPSFSSSQALIQTFNEQNTTHYLKVNLNKPQYANFISEFILPQQLTRQSYLNKTHNVCTFSYPNILLSNQRQTKNPQRQDKIIIESIYLMDQVNRFHLRKPKLSSDKQNRTRSVKKYGDSELLFRYEVL